MTPLSAESEVRDLFADDAHETTGHRIDSERVGALLDTGNVLQFGYPEQWIRILGARIGEVHLKDYRQGVGTIEGFVSLLDGDVNWGEVMAALQEIGYEGFLTAEMFPYKHHGDTIIVHTSEAMDRIIGDARRGVGRKQT